jgi:hypothetical protein
VITFQICQQEQHSKEIQDLNQQLEMWQEKNKTKQNIIKSERFIHLSLFFTVSL